MELIGKVVGGVHINSKDEAVWLGENRWVQQTPEFISSPVIKLVTDKTYSLLRHDSSEELPTLHCM